MANANETSPANTKEFLGTLPFRSQDRNDQECNLDVSIWRCNDNECERSDVSPCDTLTRVYYGSAEDEVTKFCPRHFYEMHYGMDASYQLVDAASATAPAEDLGTEEVTPIRGAKNCKTCGSEIVESINDSNFCEGECGPCEYLRYSSQAGLLKACEGACDMICRDKNDDERIDFDQYERAERACRNAIAKARAETLDLPTLQHATPDF